jgi:hypothetical protein
MTLDNLRQICGALPAATEDVKWGQDRCFCVGGKMFAAVNLEPPHQLGFKCSPETYAELLEREGIVPAPYLARGSVSRRSRSGRHSTGASSKRCCGRPTSWWSRSCQSRSVRARLANARLARNEN